jgi:hypothetical protein
LQQQAPTTVGIIGDAQFGGEALDHLEAVYELFSRDTGWVFCIEIPLIQCLIHLFLLFLFKSLGVESCSLI